MAVSVGCVAPKPQGGYTALSDAGVLQGDSAFDGGGSLEETSLVLSCCTMALRDVAVCVDTSEHSEHAWRWTIALLEAAAAASDSPRVRLISVAVAAPLDLWTPDEEPPWLVATASSEEDRTRKAEEARAVAVAQGAVADLLDRIPPPQHVSVTTLTPLVCGTIGETIIASLKEHPPGLCVCGARGMGSFRRLVVGLADTLLRGLGSVSDHMVHNAPWPVVVVKHPRQ